MTMPRSTTCAVACCALVTWFGCSQGSESLERPPGATQGGEATPIVPSEAEDQSDERILAILGAMVRTEIEHGQLALERAQSPQVREFADSLVQKHSASEDEVTRIATTNGMTAQSGRISRELSAKANHSLQTLSAADAATFDEVFLELQIGQHREFLSWLNTRLLPDVDTEALLHQMQAMRDSAEQDLMRAEKLASQLARTGSQASASN